MYLHQVDGTASKLASICFLKLFIKIFAYKGAIELPIAIFLTGGLALEEYSSITDKLKKQHDKYTIHGIMEIVPGTYVCL